MVSKSSAPHSIRFRNELWERVCAHAKRDGMTPNEAVIALVTAGLTEPPIKLQRVRPGLRKPAKTSPPKTAAPFRGVTATGEALPKRGAYQKKGKT